MIKLHADVLTHLERLPGKQRFLRGRAKGKFYIELAHAMADRKWGAVEMFSVDDKVAAALKVAHAHLK